MFIGKSMTKKVITIQPDANIFEAKEKMTQYHIRHIPVVDINNKLMGIVTDRDIRSALPSPLTTPQDPAKEKEALSTYKINDIMTRNPVVVSPSQTIQDALLLIQNKHFGALPVVDEQQKLIGIITTRDLLRAFINTMGIKTPGILIGIVVGAESDQLKKIIDVLTAEKIPVGSILVSEYREEDKRVVFPYLMTQNVYSIKQKLEAIGFTILDPMEWHLDQLHQDE